MVCDYVDFMSETVVMEFSNARSMLSASLSMLLYLVSVLDTLLLVNVMGCNIILSSGSFHGQFIPTLTSRHPAPKPTSEASLSKCNGYFLLQHFM